MASFSDAIELSQTTGLDINDTGGVFGRVGWADGQVEPWDLTDIDQTFQAGGSITGKEWGGLTIRSARSVYQMASTKYNKNGSTMAAWAFWDATQVFARKNL